MDSHLILKYWVAARTFFSLCNALFMRGKGGTGLFLNPSFLRISHGDPHFLSHFQILPYILNLAISQITKFGLTSEALLPP